jgi:hypothetical protein
MCELETDGGNGRGLIEVLTRHLPEGAEENHEEPAR